MSVFFNEEEADRIVNKILNERLIMSDVLFFQKGDQVFEVKSYEVASREGIQDEITELETLLEAAKAKLVKFDAMANPPAETPSEPVAPAAAAETDEPGSTEAAELPEEPQQPDTPAAPEAPATPAVADPAPETPVEPAAPSEATPELNAAPIILQ